MKKEYDKYQEALIDIKKLLVVFGREVATNSSVILEEAVRKAGWYDNNETPARVGITKKEQRSIDLKTGKIKYGYVGCCPDCNSVVYYNWQDYRSTNYYCNYCGQKLDWKEYD